jgi:tRNA pseudouridine38-40 synthase
MTRRYKMTVAYDGTAYAGWQIQPNGMTIQEKLEEALRELSGERAKVHGSGRTDQGVHGRRQVAHFDLARQQTCVGLRRGMNALLPPDIRVMRIEKADPEFHARRDATSKEYRYFIWNADVVPPFQRQYRTHVREPLDVSAMGKAAGYLVGRHDFAAFSANPNRDVESTVRRLTALTVKKRGAEIVIAAEANGFLYKMVRSIAGFLIRVGEGAVPPSDARTILASRVRTARVPTAPPQGLFLWCVSY